LAHNFHAAEDLVHDTVVKAYSCVGKFQPGSNLRAWLFTILRNTFYSGMRKQKREVADPDGHFAATLVTQPEHDGRLAMSEFLGAFAQLSSEHRDIVTLVGVSGHTYNVASRMIGIPVGTAKSRLSRARALLTETLDASAVERPGPPVDCAIPLATRKASQDGKQLFH
jgi:RNA polymerase sigma-70 factor (ECF subfamily)